MPMQDGMCGRLKQQDRPTNPAAGSRPDSRAILHQNAAGHTPEARAITHKGLIIVMCGRLKHPNRLGRVVLQMCGQAIHAGKTTNNHQMYGQAVKVTVHSVSLTLRASDLTRMAAPALDQARIRVRTENRQPAQFTVRPICTGRNKNQVPHRKRNP